MPRGGRFLLFGVAGHAKLVCEQTAREAGFRGESAKDLRQGCRMLGLQETTLLVIRTAARPWDRDILEEHASRAGASVFVHHETDAMVRRILERTSALERGSAR